MLLDNPDFYYAQLIEDLDFSDEELLRMGISFFDSYEEIIESLTQNEDSPLEEFEDLSEYKLTIGILGPMNNPKWVLYSMELNFELVKDVWNKENFYNITRQNTDGVSLVYQKVHLRKNHIEEDMKKYIELDQNKTREYPIFSDFVH